MEAREVSSLGSKSGDQLNRMHYTTINGHKSPKLDTILVRFHVKIYEDVPKIIGPDSDFFF